MVSCLTGRSRTSSSAINKTCDFVSETLHVTMLYLTGLFRGDTAIQPNGEQVNAKYFSAADLSSFSIDVHAGVGETSGMLALHPIWFAPTTERFSVARSGRSMVETARPPEERASITPTQSGYLRLQSVSCIVLRSLPVTFR